MLRILPTLAAFAALGGAARAQFAEITVQGLTLGENLGAAAIRFVDRDGDGQDDLLVGAPRARPGGILEAGTVRVFSSRTGQVLAAGHGTVPLEHLGHALVVLVDMNGDGVPEVAAGAPGLTGGIASGGIRLLDGATLQAITALPGPSPGAHLGMRLVPLADQTGDGVPEFAASAPTYTAGIVLNAGAVFVIDATTGGFVRTFTGAAIADTFGSGLDTIGDLNGDGRPELVIGAPGFDPPGKNGAGRVIVADPVSGQTLLTFDGTVAGAAAGFSCAGLLDVDGNSVPDVLVGEPGAGAGRARVYSGAGGALLHQHAGLLAGDGFGAMVAGLGDVDGDGRGDYAVGAPDATVAGWIGAGRLTVFRGRTHQLLYDFAGSLPFAGVGGFAGRLGKLGPDKFHDFIDAAPGDDTAGDENGRLAVRHGQVPRLVLESSGQFGSPFTLRLQASPGEFALLMADLGLQSPAPPLGKLALAQSPSLAWWAFGTVGPGGFLIANGVLPATGVPPGTTIYAQGVVAEAFSPKGYRAGNVAALTLVP